jgi:cyclophilin family peptidyl-prolyl cis-trans isomerase
MYRELAARGGRPAVWLLVLFGLAVCPGCAGSTPAAQPNQTAPQSQERADFEQVLSQWRPFLIELRQLKEQYDTAEPDQEPELRKRYQQMVEKGAMLEEELVATALKACVRQPKENEDLARFLMEVVRYEFRQENYEECLRMAQRLIDNRVGDYSMYYAAALAGCAVGEFELAEKHFQLLDEKQIRLGGTRNPLASMVKECRQNLEYYKEAWPKEQAIREKEKRAGDLPRVLLKTTKGEIELELFENEAPNTVANFVSLVEKGFYDGLTFHRVLSAFVAQGGCPKGDGSGGPDYTIRCECYQPNHRLHFRGSISMAHAGRDTGGSQFFLVFRPARHLDGKHTVFGRVVRGMEVMARLQRRDPDPERDDPEYLLSIPKADKILEARVLRKRNHPYEPKVLLIPEDDGLPEEFRESFRQF